MDIHTRILTRRFTLDAEHDVDEKRRAIDVIASTDAEDSYEEVVLQNWDLTRYQRNPVVLWNHNSAGGFLQNIRQEEMLPIGHSEKAEIRGGKLRATIRLVDGKANPMGERVYQ